MVADTDADTVAFSRTLRPEMFQKLENTYVVLQILAALKKHIAVELSWPQLNGWVSTLYKQLSENFNFMFIWNISCFTSSSPPESWNPWMLESRQVYVIVLNFQCYFTQKVTSLFRYHKQPGQRYKHKCFLDEGLYPKIWSRMYHHNPDSLYRTLMSRANSGLDEIVAKVSLL